MVTPVRRARLVGLLSVSLWACAAAEVTQSLSGEPSNLEPDAATGGLVPGAAEPNADGGQLPVRGEPNATTEPTAPVVTEPNAPAPAPGQVRDTYALRYLGRITQDTNVVSWPGPVAQVDFLGTRGSIALRARSGTSAVRLDVDGEAQQRILVTGDSTLRFGPLPRGVHRVVLTKLSEAALGTLTLGEVQTDGTAAPSLAPTRRIAFVGDAVAAGFGIDALAPCNNTAGNENVGASYAALVAQAFDADYTVSAWSGMGLLRNISDTLVVPPLTMLDYWDRQDATDPNARIVPDVATAPQVVVVALGTDDARYRADAAPARAPLDHAAFVDAYVRLLQRLAAAYPRAKFVLCGSPMLQDAAPYGPDALHANLRADLVQVVARVGAQRARWVDVPSLPESQRTACGAHPNRAGQQTLARLVAGAIRAQAGW